MRGRIDRPVPIHTTSPGSVKSAMRARGRDPNRFPKDRTVPDNPLRSAKKISDLGSFRYTRKNRFRDFGVPGRVPANTKQSAENPVLANAAVAMEGPGIVATGICASRARATSRLPGSWMLGMPQSTTRAISCPFTSRSMRIATFWDRPIGP